MKNNKKRGFTLVELLVVIAILAILATVAVVGYTSFIERATVSNDENVVTQLNKFLTALKADHTSDFYGDVINEDNIWEVTQEILKESGLNDLEAQAAKYGYHIYFDIDKGEYALMKDKDAVDAPSAFDNFLIALTASAADKTGLNSLNPTNAFTKEGKYCFVETKGDWGDVISAYYNVTCQDDLRNLYRAAQAMKTAKNATVPGLASGVVLKNKSGLVITITDTEVIVGDERVTIEEKNTVTDFKVSISHTNTSKVNPSDNTAFIAWDGKTFTFSTSNFVGNPNFPGVPVTSEDVSWDLVYALGGENNTVDYSTYVSLVDGVLTLTADENGFAPAINEIKVRATATAGGHTEEYTLKVVRITGITGVKLGGESLDLDGDDTLTFVNTVENNANKTFSLSFNANDVSYNYMESGVTPDVVVTIGNTNEELTLSEDKKTISLVSTLEELSTFKTISVKVENLLEENVQVRFISAQGLHFNVNTTNKQVVVVGDDNAITLGDLFTFNESLSIPEGAQIWFTTGFGGVDTAPGAVDTTDLGWSRRAPAAIPVTEGWANIAIQFTNGFGSREEAEGDEVYVAIVIPNDKDDYTKGGRRISATRKIAVVDGYNINKTNYSEVIAKANNKTSFVMWSDIAMTDNQNIIIKSLYGNNFTYDIKKGAKTAASGFTGIIDFYGTIRDVKIIGDVYPDLAFQVDALYGTAALCTRSNDCKVINCYISNTRAPLRLDMNCLVQDTVLFGGKLANIDHPYNKVLTIKGHVVTIQQKQTAPNGKDVIGMSIAAWFSDYAKFVNIEKDAKLEQLNFLSNDDLSAMPVIGIRPKEEVGIDLEWLGIYEIEIMNTADIFAKILGNSEAYGQHFFYDKNGKQYVNTGIVAIDKYLYEYSTNVGLISDVTYKTCTKHAAGACPADRSGCCSKSGPHGKDWPWDAGHYTSSCKLEEASRADYVQTVTFNFKQHVSVAVSFEIKYNKDKFTCADYDPEGTGVAKINNWSEGAGATKAVVFTVKETKTHNASGYNLWADGFELDNTGGVAMVLNGGKGINGYDGVEYLIKVDNWAINLGWDYLAGTLASKGLHSKEVVLGIDTPIAEGNDKLLQTYLGAVETGHYLPTNTDTFDENGNINFYVYQGEGK